jgi:hypothetical protein
MKVNTSLGRQAATLTAVSTYYLAGVRQGTATTVLTTGDAGCS